MSGTPLPVGSGPGKRLRVGITGGIGSGKSAVTDRLEERGIEIIDADKIARDVVAPGTSALAEISARFGAGILNGDGSLNRAALRKIVFEEPRQRVWLEALTHPLIGAAIAEGLEHASSPYAVLSSPLLLEGSQKEAVDYIVVVDVPEEVQLERTMARDSNDAKLVRAIMQAQLPRDKRVALADELIDNSGSLEELESAVDALDVRLRKKAAGVAA